MSVRPSAVACLYFFLLATVLIASGDARAENFTFSVKSEHPNIVSLEFYSEDRAAAWPGNGEVYIIDDDETHEYVLSCEAGEKICLGAWVRGREREYWGVGKDAQNSCTSCCYICDGGRTKTQVLNN